MTQIQNKSVSAFLGAINSGGSRNGPEEFEIFSASDLPTPSGGTIVLPSGHYIFKESLTLSDTLTLAEDSDIKISSASPDVVLTYTGTGIFFLTAPAKAMESFSVQGINVDITNAGGTLFGLALTSFLTQDSLFTLNEGTLGVILMGSGRDIQIDSCEFDDFDDGFSLSTVAGRGVSVNDSRFVSSAGSTTTILNVATSATKKIDLRNVTFAAANGSALFIPGAFTGQANLSSVRVTSGDLFSGSSLDETSIYVNVQDSAPSKSSYSIGSSVMSGNALTTTISDQSTFTDLNLSAAALGLGSEQFTLASATTGEITYIGLTPFSGCILATLTGRVLSANAAFHLRAVLNGNEITGAVFSETSLNTASQRTMTIIVPVTMVTGDAIRVQVSNIDNTNNIDVASYSMVVQ